MKIAYFSAQDGSENDPKLAQDWSKMVMTAIFFHVAFCLQFGTVFGFVLAPCWDPFGLQDLLLWRLPRGRWLQDRFKINEKIHHIFGTVFDLFWDPIWEPFGTLFGVQIDTSSVQDALPRLISSKTYFSRKPCKKNQ